MFRIISSALRKMPGYFSGLSSPSADAEHHHLGVFAEIVTGGANQIAHVLDEQQSELFDSATPHRYCLHHARIQMAGARGGDLAHRISVPGEPDGVVFRLDIACEHGHARARRQHRESALEERRLARARASR